MYDGIWTLAGMLLTVIVVLVLTYLASRWIALRGAGGGLNRFPLKSAAAFSVVGQLSLGRDEKLLLVRLRDKCYFLGVTSKNISVLAVLEKNEAQEFFDRTAASETQIPDILQALQRSGDPAA